MLSRKVGRNYVILGSDNMVPIKINKNRTDRKLNRLKSALSTIQKELADAYNEDSDLYTILRDEIFDGYDTRGLYDGRSGWVDDVLYRISDVQETLDGEDDEIPEEEDIITLEDIGYADARLYGCRIWEKTIEDTEEKEVTEEIICGNAKNPDATPIRRVRTTLWEKTEYGKASISITYRKLRIGKKLRKVIDNTISQKKEA